LISYGAATLEDVAVHLCGVTTSAGGGFYFATPPAINRVNFTANMASGLGSDIYCEVKSTMAWSFIGTRLGRGGSSLFAVVGEATVSVTDYVVASAETEVVHVEGVVLRFQHSCFMNVGAIIQYSNGGAVTYADCPAASTTPSPIATPTSTPKLNPAGISPLVVGLIIGGSILGVALIAAVAILLWWCCRTPTSLSGVIRASQPELEEEELGEAPAQKLSKGKVTASSAWAEGRLPVMRVGQRMDKSRVTASSEWGVGGKKLSRSPVAQSTAAFGRFPAEPSRKLGRGGVAQSTAAFGDFPGERRNKLGKGQATASTAAFGSNRKLGKGRVGASTAAPPPLPEKKKTSRKLGRNQVAASTVMQDAPAPAPVQRKLKRGAVAASCVDPGARLQDSIENPFVLASEDVSASASFLTVGQPSKIKNVRVGDVDVTSGEAVVVPIAIPGALPVDAEISAEAETEGDVLDVVTVVNAGDHMIANARVDVVRPGRVPFTIRLKAGKSKVVAKGTLNVKPPFGMVPVARIKILEQFEVTAGEAAQLDVGVPVIFAAGVEPKVEPELEGGAMRVLSVTRDGEETVVKVLVTAMEAMQAPFTITLSSNKKKIIASGTINVQAAPVGEGPISMLKADSEVLVPEPEKPKKKERNVVNVTIADVQATACEAVELDVIIPATVEGASNAEVEVEGGVMQLLGDVNPSGDHMLAHVRVDAGVGKSYAFTITLTSSKKKVIAKGQLNVAHAKPTPVTMTSAVGMLKIEDEMPIGETLTSTCKYRAAFDPPTRKFRVSPAKGMIEAGESEFPFRLIYMPTDLAQSKAVLVVVFDEKTERVYEITGSVVATEDRQWSSRSHKKLMPTQSLIDEAAPPEPMPAGGSSGNFLTG
jgi:hypothetical protein